MTLLPGQILIVGTILLFILYAFRLRSLLRDRVILALLATGGTLLAVWPDVATGIANRLGIGRGTDLLLYVFLLFSLFAHVHIFWRLRKLNRQVTQLTRDLALQGAARPGLAVPAVPLQGDGPGSDRSTGPVAFGLSSEGRRP